MRKALLFCSCAVFLSACAPSGDRGLRSRESRRYPDATQGTDNVESQWYKTQIVASPSASGASATAPAGKAPGTNLPARSLKTPATATSPVPGASVGSPPAGI